MRCEGCERCESEECESEVRGCKSEVVDTGWGISLRVNQFFFPVRIIFT